jgi:hypothetical protein
MPNNTLGLYCKFRGWQGGTIHQAMEDFNRLPLKEKDKFCGILVDTMPDNTDLQGLKWFMENRNKHIFGV